MTQSIETIRRWESPSEEKLQLVGSLAMESVELEDGNLACLAAKVDQLKSEMDMDPTYTKVQLRYFIANTSSVIGPESVQSEFSHDNFHKEFLAKYKLESVFGFSDTIKRDTPSVKHYPVPGNENFYITQEVQYYPHEGVQADINVEFFPGKVHGYRYILEYIDPIEASLPSQATSVEV